MQYSQHYDSNDLIKDGTDNDHPWTSVTNFQRQPKTKAKTVSDSSTTLPGGISDNMFALLENESETDAGDSTDDAAPDKRMDGGEGVEKGKFDEKKKKKKAKKPKVCERAGRKEVLEEREEYRTKSVALIVIALTLGVAAMSPGMMESWGWTKFFM